MILIEVGCGGRLPSGYIGADLTKRLDHAARPFVTSEASKLPFKSRTADLISCSHLVEHLTPKYFVDCLGEWNRVLKIGGEIEVRCPNAIIYLSELLDFFLGNDPIEEIKNRPYDIWPVVNVTGFASIGDHMVNRNHFSLPYLRHFIERYGGFDITNAEVIRTRANKGVEFRHNGDLRVRGRKCR